MAYNCNSIPVVFVHGRGADPGVWSSMMYKFKQAGYQNSHLFAWDYRNDTHKSTNEQLSPLFDNYINSVLNETGASKVDIVAHSFGSLPTRWFIKFGGGSTKVRNWISIAGPNHGLDSIRGIGLTINNLFTSDQGGADMQSSSYVIRKLNEGTETPEPTKYTTISSTGDDPSFFDMLGSSSSSSSSNSSDKVVSISSTKLTGANNIVIHDENLGHNALIRDERVFSHVLNVLGCDA